VDPEKKKFNANRLIKKIDVGDILILLTILLGIFTIYLIILTYSINADLQKNTEAIKEKLKPANIEITLIKDSKCTDCSDLLPIINQIKTAKVNVSRLNTFEYGSKDGREIIAKYKIQKVPAVIITGDINKSEINGLEKRENALLFTNIEPPYTNVLNGEVEGIVKLYILNDPKCEKCNDLMSLIIPIKLAGIKIIEQRNVSISSDEGKGLIEKYKIDFAPTIILSKDAGLYSIIQKKWPQIGSKENDGSYILRMVYPPFINLTTGNLRGIVNIIYLTDKTCSQCYDVRLHRAILVQSFAVNLDKEETFDISDDRGKELIAKYNISQVPAVILSDDINAYPSSPLLKQFYSVDKDGSYIFRKLQVLGTYKDLTTNQIVKVPQKIQQQ